MKYAGAQASCPQRTSNCGAKGGQDARAPVFKAAEERLRGKMRKKFLWAKWVMSGACLLAFAITSRGQDLASFEKRVTNFIG